MATTAPPARPWSSWPTGNPVRFRPGGLVLDAALARSHVYRTMDARASVGWKTPLDDARPTLAEFLGAKGYATAGFVANTSYCARDSGLGRGFTEYQDFIFPGLTALKQAVLINRPGGDSGDDRLPGRSDRDRRLAIVSSALRRVVPRRSQARGDGQSRAARLAVAPAAAGAPFFAFLNYFDAHYPYRLPAGRYHRFGGDRQTPGRAMIEHWGEMDKTPLASGVAFAAELTTIASRTSMSRSACWSTSCAGAGCSNEPG